MDVNIERRHWIAAGSRDKLQYINYGLTYVIKRDSAMRNSIRRKEKKFCSGFGTLRMCVNKSINQQYWLK